MADPKRKSRRRWFLVILLVLAVGGTGAWMKLRGREVITTVQTDKVGRRNLTELVVANGRVQPVLQVVIQPEVSGEIIELPVKEGQGVKPGDVLVRIKPDNYLASRNSAAASHQSALAAKTLAQANLTKAEVEFRRNQQLFDRALVSESQFIEAKTTLEVMKATLVSSGHQADQAKAALARAEDDLAKTTIHAPMAGTVTRLRSQKGERVVGTALMAGTEIMTIADLHEMEARVDIGEMDVILIQPGQKARLEVDAFRDRRFHGTVTEIANAAKGQAGSANANATPAAQQEATKFEVKIRITEKEAFRPGMSVTAEIETRSRTNVLTVPIQSVTTRVPRTTNAPPAGSPGATNAFAASTNATPGRAGDVAKPIEVVFAVQGDTVTAVPVKRGISDDAFVEIVEGLAEGREIVTGGYKAINRELEDGRKIVRGTVLEESGKDEK